MWLWHTVIQNYMLCFVYRAHKSVYKQYGKREREKSTEKNLFAQEPVFMWS